MYNQSRTRKLRSRGPYQPSSTHALVLTHFQVLAALLFRGRTIRPSSSIMETRSRKSQNMPRPGDRLPQAEKNVALSHRGVRPSRLASAAIVITDPGGLPSEVLAHVLAWAVGNNLGAATPLTDDVTSRGNYSVLPGLRRLIIYQPSGYHLPDLEEAIHNLSGSSVVNGRTLVVRPQRVCSWTVEGDEEKDEEEEEQQRGYLQKQQQHLYVDTISYRDGLEPLVRASSLRQVEELDPQGLLKEWWRARRGAESPSPVEIPWDERSEATINHVDPHKLQTILETRWPGCLYQVGSAWV